MIYAWTVKPKGAPAADVAAAEIERLTRMNGGGISPEAVVEAARDPKSVLHEAFEWDDSAAAEEHRKWQARTMIGSIKIVEERGSGSEVRHLTIRAFAHVSEREGEAANYKPMMEALSDEHQRRQVFGQALSTLTQWKRRYGQLKEFVRVSEAIDVVLAAAEEPRAATG